MEAVGDKTSGALWPLIGGAPTDIFQKCQSALQEEKEREHQEELEEVLVTLT